MIVKQEFIPLRDAAADHNSVPLGLGDNMNYAIDISFTGVDVVGTLSLQASLIANPSSADWKSVPNSSRAVTASAGVLYDVPSCAYNTVRVVWDYTSGTGNMSAIATIKEVKKSN